MVKSVKCMCLNICYVLYVLLWIKYCLMWFENLLVFILFKLKKHNISGIWVVRRERTTCSSLLEDSILYCFVIFLCNGLINTLRTLWCKVSVRDTFLGLRIRKNTHSKISDSVCKDFYSRRMSPTKCVFGCEGKITLFRFPKNPALRVQWLQFGFLG